MDNLLGLGDGAVLPFISKACTSSNLFLIEGKLVLVAGAGSAHGAALSEAIRGLSTVSPSFSATSPWRASHSQHSGMPSGLNICHLGTSLPVLALWLAKANWESGKLIFLGLGDGLFCEGSRKDGNK